MRIAIAATHGVGKSTFARALAKELGATYIHDVAREEAPVKGFEINEKTPPEVQIWMASRQWELETATPEPWVADKCLMDYLIYGEIVLKDQKVKEMIRWLVERNIKYDFVFYIPIEFEMEEDGLRSKDLQPVVDEAYRKYLDGKGIKYFTLTGSVQNRISQALKHINEAK